MSALQGIVAVTLIALVLKVGNVPRFLRRLSADPGRQRRYSAVIIGAYVVGFLVRVRMGYSPGVSGDFAAFLTAGRIVHSGQADRLYDLGFQAEVQQRILRPRGGVYAGGLLPYINPPFFAYLFSPLSRLSLQGAFVAWTLVNVGLILTSVAMLVDTRDAGCRQEFVLNSLVVFAFFPVLEALVKGQSSFVLLFALVTTYWSLKRDREYLAGVALGLGLAKPQLVTLMMLHLVYQRRWRALAGFAATGTVLVTGSCALVGLGGARAYSELARALSAWDAFPTAAPQAMPNVRGTIYRAALLVEHWLDWQPSDVVLTAVTAALSLGIVALVFGSWRKLRGAGSAGSDLGLAVAVTGGLLVSPHLHGHDLSLLVLVGWLVLRYAASTGRSAQARQMIAAAHPTPLLLPGVLSLALGRQVLALLMLALLVVLARWAARDHASLSAPPP